MRSEENLWLVGWAEAHRPCRRPHLFTQTPTSRTWNRVLDSRSEEGTPATELIDTHRRAQYVVGPCLSDEHLPMSRKLA